MSLINTDINTNTCKCHLAIDNINIIAIIRSQYQYIVIDRHYCSALLYFVRWCKSNQQQVNQRRAKLYILSRNHNQYATGGRFRTTKSKPICITAFFRNQNRNQYLYFEQIRNQNQNQYALAALFKIKTATNMIILEILIK